MKSKELQELITIIRAKRMAKGPPGKLLAKIFLVIERRMHYGRYRSWELLVEMLATYLGITKTKHMKLFRHLNKSHLLEHYTIAAQNNPWDHIGELYTEQGLVGPGQNMTPKEVVDLMIKMNYPEPVTKVTTQLDTLVRQRH